MKKTEILGYIGAIVLNCAALLPIILITKGIYFNTGVIMASLLLMGLVLILIRSLANNDLLNTINCLVGASLNAYLLTLIT